MTVPTTPRGASPAAKVRRPSQGDERIRTRTSYLDPSRGVKTPRQISRSEMVTSQPDVDQARTWPESADCERWELGEAHRWELGPDPLEGGEG
jgi:hypothetical protein